MNKKSKYFLSKNSDHVLCNHDFPLSSKYSPSWIFENQMGPNVLWLTEWLTREMNICSGMRVLDMGCGKAVSSIFLANEFDVEVWANDLWINAAENWQRVHNAGMDTKVFPIYAEAHNLPYADEFFDCIISVDSYHYYGTDDLYLGYLQRFVKPGGQIGIVVPGLHKEFDNGIPEHLTKKQHSGGTFWSWDCCSFHTKQWWHTLWSQYPFLNLDRCDFMQDGGHLWLKWEHILDASGGKKMFPSDIEALSTDNNQYLTFIRVIANRNNYKIDFIPWYR
jgi:ubiquinone/menaquinone biosynthesis C-methylase UbiE